MATKYKNNNEPAANVINIIGNGTEIKGDIVAKGDIRIDGKIIGNLTTQHKLIIGETGYIEGEIKAAIADISGKAKGKLFASQISFLRSTANFEGELTTDKLVIEEGAIFNGTCNMKKATDDTEQQKDAKQKNSK